MRGDTSLVESVALDVVRRGSHSVRTGPMKRTLMLRGTVGSQ